MTCGLKISTRALSNAYTITPPKDSIKPMPALYNTNTMLSAQHLHDPLHLVVVRSTKILFPNMEVTSLFTFAVARTVVAEVILYKLA